MDFAKCEVRSWAAEPQAARVIGAHTGTSRFALCKVDLFTRELSKTWGFLATSHFALSKDVDN